jgi:hypothetical protein
LFEPTIMSGPLLNFPEFSGQFYSVQQDKLAVLRIRTFRKSDPNLDPVKNRPDPQHGNFVMSNLNKKIFYKTA